MRKHDKMSRFGALFLVLAMMVTLCLPGVAMAKEGDVPQETDKGTVKIKNIEGTNPKVQLYKIVEAQYGPNGGLEKYQLVKNAKEDPELKDFNIEKPTTNQINLAAQKFEKLEKVTDPAMPDVLEKTFTCGNLPAGAYIAIVKADDYVYNPMYLAVGYDKDNTLLVGEVNADGNYLYGDTGVAKGKKPGIDKEVIGGITPDDDKNTAGVGEVVKYKVTPTIPTYPKNAKNKTFFISDQMGAGLEFLPKVTITIGENEIPVTVTDEDGNVTNGGKAVAKIKKNDNGFNLTFIYDSIINDNGSLPEITVEYSARITEKAVVGGAGNENDAKLVYANNPNEGTTHDSTDEPEDGATGVKTTEDKETIYTYQIALHKTNDENKALKGAIFGVYKDKKCTKKIDQIVTNDEGYAVSNKVASGTYYVKELQAPEGYTLNTKVYSVEANWTSAKYTAETTVDIKVYTDKPADAQDNTQVGWIKDKKFYALDVFQGAEAGVKKAYIKKASSTTTTKKFSLENEEAGNGTALVKDSITNTKTPALPSTGGMGTYVFTILGVAIIAIAGGLYMKKRDH